MTRHIAPAAAAVVLLLAAVPARALAHVRYVTPGGEGRIGELLGAVASDPLALALLFGGGVGTVVAGAGWLRFRPLRTDLAVLRTTLRSYDDLLPWLARLAIGLPLVGAGFTGYLFSPVATAEFLGLPGPAVRLFGIGVGFLLVFGFATRLAAAVGLAGYALGLALSPALLLALEYAPGLLAILLLGGGRPSADHVFSRLSNAEGSVYQRIDPVRETLAPIGERLAARDDLVPVVVRVGLGASFVYLGIVQKLLMPGQALAVVAKYDLTAVVPVSPELWVVGAALTEVALGIALALGLFTRAGCGVAILMFTTTLFGLPDDPVMAHVSLFGLVSVLVITGGGAYSLDRWLAERFDTDADVQWRGDEPTPTAD
ncbi:DoxX family protein [Halolamina sp. CBA1230]|uniref:DoxX family protein n=1 Tax=Halolamina sp. CBA1230 TaxID=1853690 RepID=UPI0009A23200|nr:DoxX family protein [Halolamina sp. CBA1230]QKY19922.1 DoxX family protein [Halolamina sp. CBA1230]